MVGDGKNCVKVVKLSIGVGSRFSFRVKEDTSFMGVGFGLILMGVGLIGTWCTVEMGLSNSDC